MPSLPMYRTEVVAPQWRALFVPGGYEFYEINLPANQLLLRIGIGNPYSPEYRQLHHQYLRSPTRYPPAFPADFPFAFLDYHGRRTLLDGRGMELKFSGGSSIQLGPAEIIWEAAAVRCSWANGTPDLHFEADPKISIQTNTQGEIREFSHLRKISPNSSEVPPEIAHVFAPVSNHFFTGTPFAE